MAHELPSHLDERVRSLNDAPLRRGDYVLYWMHHAMRAGENPALETALALGEDLGLPVLVYQGLGGQHPYNSDRHHFFILQGARDVAAELAALDIRYVFHLPTARGETSPLRTLCDHAACLVMEEMPVPPFRGWQAALARRTDRAVMAVDTRCLVPMQSVGEAYDRAYLFRRRVEKEYRQRAGASWPGEARASRGLAAAPVPGLDGLAQRDDGDLLRLIARCDIDHGVWPVFHTPGGSRAAETRWATFRRRGLASYHRLRNDAAVEPPEGVSRLSAYLHYGQISPFRLAREATGDGGPGAEKFLDELLVWRELAHNLCFHTADPESLTALPDWARETLADHADDPRQRRLDREQLARARSGDPLWDAAQRSLLRHGELHNNLRMTWAKAIPQWTSTPEAALATLIDLNHRYALDGNDPNSYGGLLWALGAFDRPFEPDAPVLGRVRPRSTRAHAKRLDLTAYRRRIDRPAAAKTLRVAVVGAGMAGLAAARSLADAGHAPVVFEKSRGPGGRAATRRAGPRQFDHGAQYFSVRDPSFRRHVDAWIDAGIVSAWPRRVARPGTPEATPASGGDRFVGVPGMNAVCRHLAADLNVQYETRVSALRHEDGGWTLVGAESEGPFDAVIVSAPAPQAAELVGEVSAALRERAAGVGFRPCWAVMGTVRGGDPEIDALFFDDAALAWAAADHTKPGRPATRGWVLHATAEWSAGHLEADGDRVIALLCDRLRALAGIELETDGAMAHRWRYARVADPLDEAALVDENGSLVLCGDWCVGESRLENAWLSGIAAAARVHALAESP